MCLNIRCKAMRENAEPAIPTIADRQVPASSSYRTRAPVPPLFASAIGDTPEGVMLAAADAMRSADVDNAALSEHFSDAPLSEKVSAFSPEAVESAFFGVSKMAGTGEPILLEGTPTLDAAVARVVGLREW